MTAYEECRQLAGTQALRLWSPGRAALRIAAPVWRRPPRGAQPIVLPPITGGTMKEIRAKAKQIKAVYAPDDSGSMYGPFGDALGVRYAAAKSLVALQRRSGGGKAGVIHWGSGAPASLATAPVDVTKGKHTLDKALTIPPTLGGNDLPAALRRTAEILLPLEPDEIPLVFVITDGIEAVTTATHDAVAALPAGCVHLLLVDRSNGCTPGMELDWATVAFGSFTRLTHLDTRAMATEIAQIYATALGFTLSTTKESTR